MDKLREIERKRKEVCSWFTVRKSESCRTVSEMDEPIMSDGAAFEESIEATDVATMTGRRATTVRARFAMDVMKDFFEDKAQEIHSPEEPALTARPSAARGHGRSPDQASRRGAFAL